MPRLKLIIILAALGAALAGLLALLLSSRPAALSARPGAKTDETPSTPILAPAAQEGEKAPSAAPAIPRVEIMPLDEKTLEQFQEANSRSMSRLLTQLNGRSYPVAVSASLCEAMEELGHDADKTLARWLSPQFQKELADENPKEAVSISRTIGNLLSMLLGDQASEEEFAVILQRFSPGVRAAAIQRREMTCRGSSTHGP